METSIDQENITKKKALNKMKRSALALLGFAVLLFIIAIYFKIPMLQAFSEAAMVGGIADWFAVVALFRHPLGIPIWHTAIIPTKKNEIGENLGNFVSEEFLNREKLEIKLEEFNFAAKASDWLSQEENADKIANLVAVNVIPGVLRTIKDEDIKRFIQVQFKEKLEGINFGDWVALALEPLQKGQFKDQLLTNLLEVMAKELSNNKDLIRKKVKQSTPFLSFGLADKSISEGVFNGLYDFLNEAKNPESTIRLKIDEYINDFLNKIKNSEEMRIKINTMILGFAGKKEVQDYINGIWDEIKLSISNDLDKGDESSIKKSISGLVQSFGNGIKEDAVMIDKINNFIKNDLLSILLNNKEVIGDLISSTVKSWDGKEVSEKLELEIGKDLQYIRINGTLVGGLIGLVIYAVEWTYHYFVI
ncbi:hypothetical protein B0A67_19625 [Flavobacterium aquidurense]|jgi:uncharacterized membrane-anchored protein YjiN (DUF445 family)|uniref:DUF445 domain-containing protein n=1 Tax=Flavobacterium aquidurense TaxID=362413 RepID=UPI000919D042|nr:DUF445 domain-containing protein [Flavobacterium aquidurense]OXA69262.1 hypothetical protein B0A67_19625 [Flavobacterium aquidurense]SHH01313.1 Uncharacterized membrane-anchored protein YjiN, DUF445 family [Flavobacterium frigidimaris]